jgi:hypothetical protein
MDLLDGLAYMLVEILAAVFDAVLDAFRPPLFHRHPRKSKKTKR